ncbi:Putative pectate lyase PlyH/PlyE, pectin lyase [Septoria linicola]|uniref:Pectate lyase n=1 Tax=Septoria linicola TaxID=215465 RepID=A0A9Q9EKF8_9PEZI|nr:putative pectate lyase PlyH/PlyE, pectin lyase [Septoria linicola]USW53237.1 Putative pectate lyase PlyH/PlyE, pectin lyase [Septoria linicola]
MKNIASVAALFALTSAQTLVIPPRNNGVVQVKTSPIEISGDPNDYRNQEFDRGVTCPPDPSDTGSRNAVFILNDGATLSNAFREHTFVSFLALSTTSLLCTHTYYHANKHHGDRRDVHCAAAEIASILERNILCEVVRQQIEDEVPVKEPGDFWSAVVTALRARGYYRTTGEVQYILNDSRNKGWAIPDAQKYISIVKRKTAEQAKRESNAPVYPAQVPDPMQITTLQAQNLQRMAQQALELVGAQEAQSAGNAVENNEDAPGETEDHSNSMAMR